MDQLNLALAVIGLVVLLVGLYSNPIKKSFLQEPMIAVLVGIAMGPFGVGWLDLAQWGESNAILKQSARITLAIGLMGVALRIEKESVRVLWRPVALLLTLGMLGMWIASSALAGWILGLSLWTALLVGAALTPTDPVVASSIVTGPFAKRYLPRRIRDAISMESGANDGLAYAFVLLPILMIEHSAREAWRLWLIDSLLVGIGGAILVGSLFGFAAAKLLSIAKRRQVIEGHSFLSYTIALSLLTLGAATLVGSDALIAVFLSGLVFNLQTETAAQHEEENVQEAVAKLFTLPIFVIFGVALPFSDWTRLGWPLLGLSVLVLLLRRLPAVSLLFAGFRGRLNAVDTAFLGWFGPIGVAGMYYAAFARGHIQDPLVWNAASAVIFASIMIHGLTAAPLTRLYAGYAGAPPEEVGRLKDISKRERESVSG